MRAGETVSQMAAREVASAIGSVAAVRSAIARKGSTFLLVTFRAPIGGGGSAGRHRSRAAAKSCWQRDDLKS